MEIQNYHKIFQITIESSLKLLLREAMRHKELTCGEETDITVVYTLI
jgi:hypothetical protein